MRTAKKKQKPMDDGCEHSEQQNRILKALRKDLIHFTLQSNQFGYILLLVIYIHISLVLFAKTVLFDKIEGGGIGTTPQD